MKNVAINGFGRIGRLCFRNLIRKSEVRIVAINDLTDTKTLAHLLKRDTVHGLFDHEISHDENSISVDGRKIKVFAKRNPTDRSLWMAVLYSKIREIQAFLLG